MSTTSFSEKFELFLLCLLLFVLPTMETPKTLALLLYVMTWVGRRASWTGLVRFRPDRVELALLAMLAAGLISTAINWPFPNGPKGVLDTLRYVILFWCIYRVGYSEPQLRLLGYAIALGVLVGLGYGVVEVLQGTRPYLEFHSAGIVTQSAIYLGIAAVAGIGFVVAGLQGRETAGWRLGFWAMATVLMIVGLFAMGSRGAIVAFVAIVLLLLVVMNQRRLWYAAAVVLLAAAALVVMLPARFDAARAYIKLEQAVTQEIMPSADLERMYVWRFAMAHLKRGEHLWFGVGPKNFQSIDAAALLPEQPRPGGFHLTHAHNMFLNKLVEEGIFGLSALLLFFGLTAVSLIRSAKSGGLHHWMWIAALGALLMPGIAGSFNTPFYQEHAMLAMAIMAMYLGLRRGPGVRDGTN
jgi:O-antigen ligase